MFSQIPPSMPCILAIFPFSWQELEGHRRKRWSGCYSFSVHSIRPKKRSGRYNCYAGAKIQIQLQNLHPTISTSQSDDRIIIRFLISRNKRNDYRLNWNSFKWKQPERRLIRKEREMAGPSGADILVDNCNNWNGGSGCSDGESVKPGERVAGQARCTGQPLSLAVGWLSEWEPALMPARHGTNAHHCIPIHLSASIPHHCPTRPYHFQLHPFRRRRVQLHLKTVNYWAYDDDCIGQYFEMITISMTTMTIIDPHIIWREWPRKSGQKGVGEFLRCSQIVLCSWQL